VTLDQIDRPLTEWTCMQLACAIRDIDTARVYGIAAGILTVQRRRMENELRARLADADADLARVRVTGPRPSVIHRRALVLDALTHASLEEGAN